MKNLHYPILSIALLGMFLVVSSCVNFKSGISEFSEKSTTKDVDQLMQEAREIEATASSEEGLQSLIDAFKKVEQADPTNYTALWNIGNYSILMGAAYKEKTSEKKAFYKEGIKYCEKAMSTNKAFADKVKNTEEVTEALDQLTISEVDAMGNWYTGRFYYFKECLNPMGRLFNTSIVIENNAMIERMDELDPDWFGGHNHFSRALYYIAVPEKFGGSKEVAEKEFEKAIALGPEFIIHRWGRAKYLYDLTGNREGFKNDLEWVLSQDPQKAGNTYPWNVYIQTDAKKMLSNMEKVSN